jgi:hypothetical protein
MGMIVIFVVIGGYLVGKLVAQAAIWRFRWVLGFTSF